MAQTSRRRMKRNHGKNFIGVLDVFGFEKQFYILTNEQANFKNNIIASQWEAFIKKSGFFTYGAQSNCLAPNSVAWMRSTRRLQQVRRVRDDALRR